MSISVTDGNRRNIDVVQGISEDLEELAPDEPTGAHDYPDLITFVEDGPEHDQRYAMVPGRIRCEQGWSPVDTFESGIRKTMKWYLDNAEWCRRVQNGGHRRKRLGLQIREAQ